MSEKDRRRSLRCSAVGSGDGLQSSLPVSPIRFRNALSWGFPNLFFSECGRAEVLEGVLLDYQHIN